jgi:predicted nuclease of predicted toxin-antitoxin system
MKFLLDQSTDARLSAYLRKLGHDVTRIAADYPAGLLDPKILSLARAEGRILITDDRDFGELVFRLKLPHAGVIFLRLGTYASLSLKIERLSSVLTHYADQLDEFLVVTRTRVRVGHEKPAES